MLCLISLFVLFLDGFGRILKQFSSAKVAKSVKIQ